MDARGRAETQSSGLLIRRIPRWRPSPNGVILVVQPVRYRPGWRARWAPNAVLSGSVAMPGGVEGSLRRLGGIFTEEDDVMGRSWRETRIAFVVGALTLLAGTPAVLRAAGIKNLWALA